MVRLGATAAIGIALCGVAATGSFAGWWTPLATVWAAVLSIGAVTGLVVWGSADPSLQLFGPAILRGSGQVRGVALTFDDGPHPDSTPALLSALRSADARATFFLLVDQAEAHPDLARAIASEHQVGLHGLQHDPWLTLRSVSRGEAELREARARLEAITGQPITLYRPPFGAVSPRLLASVIAAELTLVWCSIRTRDGGSLTASQVRERCKPADAGDIVLLHEGRQPTQHAIPEILADLQSRGLEAMTVGDLCGLA